MKQLLIDFEEYNTEIKKAKEEGKDAQRLYAFMSIVRWLESGKRLAEYLSSSKAIDYEWRELAKALGREDELEKECKCKLNLEEKTKEAAA